MWCSGRDLNPHAFRHTPLKRTCLPFHHPSVCGCKIFRELLAIASLHLLMLAIEIESITSRRTITSTTSIKLALIS